MPLLHELVTQLGQRAEPSSAESWAVACRHLAVAVRDWRRRADVSDTDEELVVALSALIELQARAETDVTN